MLTGQYIPDTVIASQMTVQQKITMTKQTETPFSVLKMLYRQFRSKGGMPSKQAMHAARTKIAFDALESRELVRLKAEDEQENYFDVYGKAEAYVGEHGRRVSAERATKELEDLLERKGCYCCVAEYFDGNGWEQADSIGMCSGYDNVLSPFENWYIVDLMASAVEKAENYIQEMAEAV